MQLVNAEQLIAVVTKNFLISDFLSDSYTTFLYLLRSWLRHYVPSRMVAGSNSNKVDFFNLPNPSSRTMTLGSTQPLTEMSTRNLPVG
jgi:hypothetical protein